MENCWMYKNYNTEFITSQSPMITPSCLKATGGYKIHHQKHMAYDADRYMKVHLDLGSNGNTSPVGGNNPYKTLRSSE